VFDRHVENQGNDISNWFAPSTSFIHIPLTEKRQ
jgi:hypothetical protein